VDVKEEKELQILDCRFQIEDLKRHPSTSSGQVGHGAGRKNRGVRSQNPESRRKDKKQLLQSTNS
jgi:hypothetical protein